jgi:hypothetical protein
MVSPKTLRTLSEQGKKDKEKREEEGRKEYDRKMREKRIEKAAQDHAEAQQRVINLEYDMQLAAKNGHTSIRIGVVYTRLISSLQGVDRIIADTFIKKGFEVDIEEHPGPEIAYEPDYIHYLVVRW